MTVISNTQRAVSFLGNLLVQPTPLRSLEQLWGRASDRPVPGQLVISLDYLLYGTLAILALITLLQQRATGRAHPDTVLPCHDDLIVRLAI